MTVDDANRGDVGELRDEMQLGFTRDDARFEKLEARMEALMEKFLRKQMQFFFLGWSVILAAIVGLYAR